MNTFATAMPDYALLAPRVESQPAVDLDNTEVSTAAVVKMLLKNPVKLNTLLRNPAMQRELMPRMLAIALGGFTVYGIVVTAVMNALRSKADFWFPHLPTAYWNDLSAANLTLGYTIGLLAANGICLPSFYFYGLLAGLRITMLAVSAHAIKGMAAGAVALVGVLPIYVAAALSAAIFPLPWHWTATLALLGLALPFIAGISGAVNLYQGFVSLADTMTCRRGASRACFLRRLILAWVSCATFVTPVVIYTLWDFLSDLVH